MQNLFLKVLIFTSHEPIRVLATVQALMATEYDDTKVVVVSTKQGELPCVHKNLEVIHIPGPSVYYLRSHIPSLSRDTHWVLILEDHNLVSEDYLLNVLTTLKKMPPQINYVGGPAVNHTSKDTWSYANFVMVLGKHWHPVSALPDEIIFFNLACRSSVFPHKNFEVGGFESPNIMHFYQTAYLSSAFVIDHVQFRVFPHVFFYHFCNGRVTGAIQKGRLLQKIKWSCKHNKNIVWRRFKTLRTTMENHPERHMIPRFTTECLFMLSVSHAFGVWWGMFFGAGSAANYLE